MVEGANVHAKQYQAIKNRLFLFNIFLNFLFLSVFMCLGWSQGSKALIASRVGGFFALNAVYFSCFSILGALLSFPFDLYEGFILEHRFGLSRQTLGAWLTDLFKKGAIFFVISLALIEAVYFFLLKFPAVWWLLAAFFWFFVSIVLTNIMPKVILPLFFKSTPLPDGPLREGVAKMLERFKIRLKNIYVLDFSKKTAKANAFVAGLGRTKQIYFSDTLVDDFSKEEVLSVLAHEVGHYVRRDTFKLVATGLVAALASGYAAQLCLGRLLGLFGISVLSDIAGLPVFLVVLMGAGLILLPLQNGFSRFLEKRADIFALATTKDPKSFISLMQRLGEKNFADPSPSRLAEVFLYNHPPLAKRIQLAEGFR